MRNYCIFLIGLFVLCTFTNVSAECQLKTFKLESTIPSDVSDYSFTLTNYGEYNIKLVRGTGWNFLIDSSLIVPSISVTIDEQARTMHMVVDELSNSFVKTAGSTNMVPSMLVLVSGLALAFGSNKRALFFLGLLLCFAASVMAFDACNTIIITYPSEMASSKCMNCENAPERMATRDVCVTPVVDPSPVTQAPVTQAPVTQAPVTQAPVTQAPITQAPVTKAPVTQAPVTQAPVTKAPVTQAPITQAPVTQAPTNNGPPAPPPSDASVKCVNHIQDAQKQYYTDARICSSTHLPFALSLSSNLATLEQQVDEIRRLNTYNDASLYSPTPAASFEDYHASFYPPERLYNNNPTQMLIGITDVVHSMNLMDAKLRLPSIYFGMFLAYAMDHYGINPHFMIAQAGKEAAATMVSPSFTKDFFTCENSEIASGGCSGKVFDCRENYDVGDPRIQGVTHQGCPKVDNFGIALGPFQLETGGFSQVVSVAPHRFWVETPGRNAAKTPLYMDSGSIASKSTNIKQLQSNYTSRNSDSLAIIGASLYHHWVHNILLSFPKMNFRSAFNARNSAQQGELAFATILYLFNRGIYTTMDFSDCKPTDDPTSSPNCPTSKGHGEYAEQIKKGTYALDQAQKVYDFPIKWTDVEFFIAQIKLSYPYQCASCDFGSAYGNIDWEDLACETYSVFEKLSSSNRFGTKLVAISFRYDWRLLLAVIRSFLPGRDQIAGPDFAPFTVRADANTGLVSMAADPGPYAAAPFGGKSWIATAGTRGAMEQCACKASTAQGTTAATTAPTGQTQPQNPAGQAKPCPADGTICTGKCSTTYYMCSGGSAYATQAVPVGARCSNGAFVLTADCKA